MSAFRHTYLTREVRRFSWSVRVDPGKHVRVQAYLPDAGGTVITKAVLPGRGPLIALRLD